MAAPSMQQCPHFHEKGERESICLRCFLTVRSGETSSLRDAEAVHRFTCEGDIAGNKAQWGAA
jgi:hypothetical protein